jgi:hypothetical protein
MHLVRHEVSASRQAVALVLAPGPGREGEEGWHSGLSTCTATGASDASSTATRSISFDSRTDLPGRPARTRQQGAYVQ